MAHTLTPADLAALERFDTPTVCNALEIVAPERRGFGFTRRPLVCKDPTAKPMVGFARTATVRATHPSTEPADKAAALRLAYYEYVAAGPRPAIVVIQDLDDTPGVGAFWGEVNTAIHLGLGCLGVVTNGSIRDLDQCAPGFGLLAGSVGPSHAHVHVAAFGNTVDVHGMVVSDGDVIHADRHGAVVVPAAVVAKIPAAVDLIARREAVILARARAEGFGIESLREALAQAREIH